MENDINFNQSIGTRLRTALLREIGSIQLVVEGEHSSTVAEQRERQRTLSDYAEPTLSGSQSNIEGPSVVANNFELKPAFVVQQSVQFHSLPNEGPNSHIGKCLEMCDTLKMNRVLEDAIRLRLFLFSLVATIFFPSIHYRLGAVS